MYIINNIGTFYLNTGTNQSFYWIQVDECLQHAILSGDPDLAFDLRELNEGKHGKYDEFWEGVSQVLERDFPPAAEERRHGDELFLPVAISIQDLKRKVLEVILLNK